MRLFIAVDPDEAVRNRIAAAVDRVRRQLGGPAGERLAWVAPENWHITLVFIGELRDEMAAPLCERFAAPFDVAAFQMSFGQPGLFPPRGRPRVFWVGVDRGRTALAALYEAVLARVEDVPFRRENRPFTPHLTLARVRPGAGAVPRVELAEARIGRLGTCPIEHVTLYRSRLSPKGAKYEVLVRAPLRAPGDLA